MNQIQNQTDQTREAVAEAGEHPQGGSARSSKGNPGERERMQPYGGSQWVFPIWRIHTKR